MGEAVTPPDAEALAVTYLEAQFAARGETAAVATKIPTTRPNRLVRVSLAETLRQTLTHHYSRLIFECWDLTAPAASQLARLTYALIGALDGETVGSTWVGEVVDVSGAKFFPDPDTNLPRYQFTADLLTRGVLV